MALYKRSLTGSNYFYFIKKRLFRIAPLYYVAILSYFFYFEFVGHIDIGWKAVLINATFLNNHFGINIAYTFWSLAVEWLFYLIIPCLFIFKDHRRQMWVFWTLMVLSFIRLYQVESTKILFSLPQMPMPLFMEFGWGILMAMILTKPNWKEKLELKQSWKNLFIGLLILYTGRLLRFTQVVESVGSFGIVFKIFSGPLLTFGFALIMFMLIRQKGIFSNFVEHWIFQFLGKCSYGIYLWHVLVIELTKRYFDTQGGPVSLLIAFFMVAALSIMLSWITYENIEKFYFKSNLSNKHKIEKQ
jgi:peptidoglycan/LPS O-acetylase OafA/YrhL